MCGSSPPPDNSAEVARIEAQQAREAREAETRRKAEEKAAFEERLSGAYSTGIDSARNYFAQEGLDPDEYIGAISAAANSARSRVPSLDGSPGTYFENLGAQVFDQLQTADQNKALRNIDTFAREGFATRRINNETDDPFLQAILEERRADADDYVRNLLDRGVITQGGYSKAIDELEGQRAGANARLQDIGLAELERGRGLLRDIAAQGRSAASNARLGDNFDPFAYQQDIDSTQANFFATLADNLRANAPKNLFDTSGLAGIAGAAQGAQNTAFDPNALAGIEASEDDDENDDDDDDDEEFTPF